MTAILALLQHPLVGAGPAAAHPSTGSPLLPPGHAAPWLPAFSRCLQTGAALEAMKISKDVAVAVLEAAGGSGQAAAQQQVGRAGGELCSTPACMAERRRVAESSLQLRLRRQSCRACFWQMAARDSSWVHALLLLPAQQHGPERPLQAALPGPGGSEPDGGCTLAVRAGGEADAASNALAVQTMCSLPFAERVRVCCSIFCATEPAQAALVRRAGCNADGFALDKE